MAKKPSLHEQAELQPIDFQMYTRYLPTAFDGTLSMLEKINKTIWKLNELGELTNDMLNKWNKVIKWVMNDGLSEAVLKQLEKWLDDGTFEDLINQNLLEDLKNEIDEIKTTKMDMDGYFIDGEYSITYHRDEKSETSYTLAHIHQKDTDGNRISIKTNTTFIGDNTVHNTVRRASVEMNATLAINATPNSGSRNSDKEDYTVLKDGEIMRTDKNEKEYIYYIAWDDKNNFTSYDRHATAKQMKDDGYTQAIPGFIPLIEDGEDIDSNYFDKLANFSDPHPRTAIATDEKGDVYFFTSTGRLMGEFGMKAKDLIRVLKSHNMKWAHMLDGGGSTTMVDKHHVVNKLSGASSGDSGSTEREVGNMLYIQKKGNAKKDTTKALATVGDATAAVYRNNQFLEQMRYQKNNYIYLGDYFINGWKPYTDSGANTPRGWILPNNTLYLRGVISEGYNSDIEESTTFMRLPPHIPPMFPSHHLVAGDNKGEIYKIVIDDDGYMTWYFWNFDFTRHTYEGDIYIRMDGIMIPLNYTSNQDKLTRTQGIQLGWKPEDRGDHPDDDEEETEPGNGDDDKDDEPDISPICKNEALDKDDMKTNAQYIAYKLQKDGWTKHAISAMLGNMQEESTINPCRWENETSYDNNPYTEVARHGYGLVQWTPFSNYTRWARDNDMDYDKMDSQIERILYEVKNGIQWIPTNEHNLTFKEFTKSKKSPEKLADAFIKNYERPADQDQPSRGDNAKEWYDELDWVDD